MPRRGQGLGQLSALPQLPRRQLLPLQGPAGSVPSRRTSLKFATQYSRRYRRYFPHLILHLVRAFNGPTEFDFHLTLRHLFSEPSPPASPKETTRSSGRREKEMTMTSRSFPRLDFRLLVPTFAVLLVAVGVGLTMSPTQNAQGGPPAAGQLPDAAEPTVGKDPAVVVQTAIDLAHAACFKHTPFPSAKKCQPCHEDHFREWSVSQHAYAQLSPVFNTFSNKLLKLTSGTNGDFCIRCHTPPRMPLKEPLNIGQMDRCPTSREGVTCVVCHRINQPWGKMSARQYLVPGDIHQAIFGPLGPEVLAEVLANPDRYGVTKTQADPATRGRDIHRDAVPFFQIVTPGFCGSCHDVFGPDGFRLEDAFSEFKMSPSAHCKKENCQDCHMGIAQGYPSGFSTSPAARMGNVHTRPRRHTNHMIVGPDYSIIHPGLFPHHPYAIREESQPPQPLGGLATMREWLTFDVDAGWGTEAFEAKVPDGYKFPDAWADAAKRRKGRDIIDYNLSLLNEATANRHKLLSIGYQVGDIIVERADAKGVRFKVKVWNGTDGHGVPTGFDAERVVYLQVTVVDANGRVVFRSGDLDPNGDLRDDHSAYVHNGELPRDKYLFSLQSKFIVSTIRGGEREQILTVPFSPDPLPYVRPLTLPFTAYGRPLLDRKQKQNLEVGGHRWAEYEVKPWQLTGRGPYSVTVRLIAGMVPVNLVNAISDVGFDYGLSPRRIADRIVAGHLV